MAANSGFTCTLEFKDDAGSPAYQFIAGLRTRGLTLNAETVDITNASSSGQWRELLSAVGVKSATLSGSGVFYDDAGFEAMRDAMFDGTLRDARLIITGLGTFVCQVKISQLEISAEFNKEVTFSCTLESSGAVTFTGS